MRNINSTNASKFRSSYHHGGHVIIADADYKCPT